MPLQEASGPPCPSAWCWQWEVLVVEAKWAPGAGGGPFSSQNPGIHCHWGDVGGYTLTLTVVQTANLSSLQFVCCPTFCGSVVPSLLMFVERSIFIFPVQQPLYLLYHFIWPLWCLWLCYILSQDKVRVAHTVLDIVHQGAVAEGCCPSCSQCPPKPMPWLCLLCVGYWTDDCRGLWIAGSLSVLTCHFQIQCCCMWLFRLLSPDVKPSHFYVLILICHIFAPLLWLDWSTNPHPKFTLQPQPLNWMAQSVIAPIPKQFFLSLWEVEFQPCMSRSHEVVLSLILFPGGFSCLHLTVLLLKILLVPG